MKQQKLELSTGSYESMYVVHWLPTDSKSLEIIEFTEAIQRSMLTFKEQCNELMLLSIK